MSRKMSRTRRVLRWVGRVLAGGLFIAIFVGVLVLIDRGETYGCGDIAGVRAEAFTIPAAARDLTPALDALRTDGRIDPAKLDALLAPQRERIAALNVLVVPIGLVSVVAVTWFALDAAEWLAIDACLDSGGAWNAATQQCER